MPNWPTRLFSGTFASNNSSSLGQSLTEAGSQDDRLRGGTQSVMPLRSPPLSASNTQNGKPIARRPSQHGRSISHPFPSIFGSGKKRNAKEEEEENVIDAKTLLVGSPGTQVAGQAGFSRLDSVHTEEVEMTSGKCATCDCQVRWPRHLDVFRCTVCLMVNDLQLNFPKSAADGSSLGELCEGSEFGARSGSPMKVPHVSVRRTQALIEQCISRHLESRSGVSEIALQTSPLTSEHWSVTRKNHILTSEQDDRSLKTLEATSIAGTGASNRPRSHGSTISSGQRSPFIPPTRSPPSSPCKGVPTNCQTFNMEAAAPQSQPSPARPSPSPPVTQAETLPDSGTQTAGRSRSDSSRSIFRSLENYIIACFNGTECLNGSFLLDHPPPPTRAKSDGAVPPPPASPNSHANYGLEIALSPLDAKILLLGDVAENGMWWTGGAKTERSDSQKGGPASLEGTKGDKISMKSPNINWKELQDWYYTVLNAGQSWRRTLDDLKTQTAEGDIVQRLGNEVQQQHIDDDFRDASLHLQRTLLKASENLLRRPGRPLRNAPECRFLLILLANPLLYPQDPNHSIWATPTDSQLSPSRDNYTVRFKPPYVLSTQGAAASRPVSARSRGGNPTNHSGITKRILGLLANLPNECHQYLVAWLSRLSEAHFCKLVDLVGSFVTYRLSRQHGRKRSHSHGPNAGLVPSLSGASMSSSAQLHAALGIAGSQKPSEEKADAVIYSEDWQIKAAARVMSLLFAANNNGTFRRRHTADPSNVDKKSTTTMSAARHRANKYGQMLPTSAFYNTLLDYSDLIADFEAWESRKGKFSFCQYPMFLSIWAKIRITEHDARRQMEIKAREAFFDSIMNRKAVSQFLVLKVRRDCLVEDSLRGVSEVVGQGQEEIKKGLRIEFTNEEGIDAGGLRKEWFLLLVREVFDPEHGLFVYDEDSRYCYFNPNSFETSDQFFLVGVVLGLALYNSTILDVALPPFAFRKLLASAPVYVGPVTSSVRPAAAYTLEDLAEFRPSLAKGLGQLLEFDGDVESTFCRDFVAEIERYGQIIQIPLCPNGEHRPVTNASRREFVDLYIRYLLDTAVARQYEPFKRGFFTVCAGNALSLFRPEEIELLVRGSDEPLDVATLQAVATYEGWGKTSMPVEEPVVQWFWEAFKNADPINQRKLLSFITASDRIPAMGAANLVIKVTCLGDELDRYPTARTCFNRLGLYRYRNQQQLETKLWRAVTEGEGFGMK